MDNRELTARIEEIAKEENTTREEILTRLQSGAALAGELELLDQLCELKWEFLGKSI